MRYQPTIAIQSSLNKHRSPGYVFVSILFTLLMTLLYVPADAAWMGVAVEDDESDEKKRRGIEITTVDADGPGARAGLRVGDLIVLVDGLTVEYYRSENPWGSVMHPSTGIQIRIKSVSTLGGFMQIEVRPAK